MQKGLLTTAHSTLFPGASQLVPVFIHTPALPCAAVALRGFVIALLVTPRYECSWENERCNLNQRSAQILELMPSKTDKRAHTSDRVFTAKPERKNGMLGYYLIKITGP